jgi:hypothetical protein
MTSPYQSPTPITGYNATPPSDDGSTVSSNQLSWAKHKTKLSDPIKTFVEAIDANVQAAFTAIYGETDAETAPGVTVVNPQFPFGDLRRIGVVPNSEDAASANASAMAAYFDPTVANGPRGNFYFPNTTGSDTYYFDGMIPFRNGVHIDCRGCILDFEKTYASGDDQRAFFMAIKDFSMINFEMHIDYNGSAGVHAGNAFRFGNRNNQGPDFPFGMEEDLPYIMGDIRLASFKIVTNNPVNDGVILALGGPERVVIEDFDIDGGGASSYGILAETGNWSDNGVPSNSGKWSSSHPAHWRISRGRIVALDDSLTEGAGIGCIGMHSSLIEDIQVDTAYVAVESRPSESLFYRVAPKDSQRTAMQYGNISGKNIANTGAVLVGASSSTSLATELATLATDQLRRAAQINLITYVMTGFNFPDAAVGIAISGPTTLRRGEIRGYSSSGAIRVFPEAGPIDFFGIRIFDGDGSAFDLANPRAISGSLTTISGRIEGCKVGGATGPGFAIADTDGLEVVNNDVGYATSLDDAADESTMTQVVSVTTTAKNVTFKNNYATIIGAGPAYGNQGTSDRGCNIVSPRGASSFTANVWQIDGVARATQGALEDATHAINTDNKYVGKQVFDVTNEVERTAMGAGTTGAWKGKDGTAAITPS